VAHDLVDDVQVQELLQHEEALEEVLMRRWAAIVAAAAVALFAASFAMARSGREQPERPPARPDSAPAALERVKTAGGVGDLRRLDPRWLPALEREPVEAPEEDEVTPPTVDDFPPTAPPTDDPPVVPPANDPPANDPPASDPPLSGGCDPCG
jgi:hypothetical protein